MKTSSLAPQPSALKWTNKADDFTTRQLGAVDSSKGEMWEILIEPIEPIFFQKKALSIKA